MLGKPFRQGNLPVSHHRRVLQNIFDQARFRYIAGCFQMQNNTLYPSGLPKGTSTSQPASSAPINCSGIR